MEVLNRMLTSSIRLNQFLTDHVEMLPADQLSTIDTTCPICEEAYLQEDANHTVSKITACSHTFHRSCLAEILDTEDGTKSCPACRNDVYNTSDRKENSTKALEDAWVNAHREAHLEERDGNMSDASVGGSDTEDEEILYESSDEDELVGHEFGGSVESTDSSEVDVEGKILLNIDENAIVVQ
jgi:hypothetical protein